MSHPPRRPLRGIPTSRAYWELKAEQMMNRVFDPEATIDLDVASQAEVPPPLPLAPAVRRLRGRPSPPATTPSRTDRNTLLLTAMGGVCMVSVASSVARSPVCAATRYNNARSRPARSRNVSARCCVS